MATVTASACRAPADLAGGASGEPPRSAASSPTPAPFGTWRSPISAALVAEAGLRLHSVALDGDDIYWIEGRPTDGGRNVLVRRAADGTVADVTPSGFNVRTRVHEYGGGAYTVHAGVIYFSNYTDQRLYRQRLGSAPEPLTAPGAFSFADCVVDPVKQRLVCVREDHSRVDAEPVNTIVSIPLAGEQGHGAVLASGADFYASPRFSPDRQALTWIQWRHPNMPWDGTELIMAQVREDGAAQFPWKVAGGPQESVLHPDWSPEGLLYWLSDTSDWWNFYRLRAAKREPLVVKEAEFAEPMWQLGAATWTFSGRSRIVTLVTSRGRARLATIDVNTSSMRELDTDAPRGAIRATATHAVFVASSTGRPDAVVRVDLESGRQEILRSASAATLDTAYLSAPEAIEFPTGGGVTAHAFYYPPTNRDFGAHPGAKPPLIVMSHGGPTSAASTGLDLETQFWTTRGFAVVDVNYGGSSGYGRAYRQRLNGRWGVVDVEDCVNAAKHLAAQGRADVERLIIRGGSAGGYTTLAALTFYPEVFKAGASYYGISDLEVLARDTHKFESRYLDTLVGPYPGTRELYRERSPIHHVARLAAPLIIFQGLDDKVVPPNQSEMMVEALRQKGVPVAYLPFEGEQHGFRKAATLVRALEAELYFYGKVFGFVPADEIAPVEMSGRPAGAR